MKKYLVIGNPIEHSLSPTLHNYWIKENLISAIYDKKKLNKSNIKDLILKIRAHEIHGINVTVPFKNIIIPYLDKLSSEAISTQSVNTIYLKDDKVVGHNTDVEGFKISMKNYQSYILNKKILILGAGGVVPSLVFALYKMGALQITVSNRTIKKAEALMLLFKNLKISKWGSVPESDVIINATSIGLNQNDKINLDLSKATKCKFFYDIIYNPKETNFLKLGKKYGKKIENGKLMFIYQAAAAFKIWHSIDPEINNEVTKLID